MPQVIRMSPHSLKYTNSYKLDDLSLVRTEYERVLKEMVNEIWHKGLTFPYRSESHTFKIGYSKLLPTSAPKEFYNSFNSWFTARLLNQISTHAIGIIKSLIKKPKYSKPKLRNIQMQLSTKNVDIEQGDHFDYFVRLKCIGTYEGRKIELKIPIKMHSQANRLLRLGSMTNGVRISDTQLFLTYRVNKDKRKEGVKLGADQGVTTCLTLSDGQQTTKCKHGHDLTTIQKKLSNKKKGSKAFRKAQAHRTNYINWSIKQLNYSGVKEVCLEKIHNLRYKKRASKYLRHWTYTNIKKQLINISEIEGFTVTERDNAFRSQRCPACSYTWKYNRKSKEFKCKHCLYTNDADKVGAINNSLELVEIPDCIRYDKSRSPFYWYEDFILYNGQVFRVTDNSSGNV